MHQILQEIKDLYRYWSGIEPDLISPLPASGSDRQYFRVMAGERSVIGAWNPVREENLAFFTFTRHFHDHGLKVPELLAVSPDGLSYLLEDLGDISLFSLATRPSGEASMPQETIQMFQTALKELTRFQTIAGKDLDYKVCWPSTVFNQRSVMFDLHYFKYYFLRLHMNFHEERLEDDFENLAAFLNEAGQDFFMYRDFQARNIMIKNRQLYFIDYQGGRKGPLQYDVASLLFQVKADLPFELRETLLEHYLDEMAGLTGIDREVFKRYYRWFVLLRLLQVMGAYGYRGLIQKKPHFMASIPYAIKNLKWWLGQNYDGPALPELMKSLAMLIHSEKYMSRTEIKDGAPLTLTLKSFSYKQGIPADESGNGGGFVFDCRALPNPGREEQFRAFNGKDPIIIDYLKNLPEVKIFLDDAEKLILSSARNYSERGFSALSVCFGCTGGQHRSVYCTETMARRLKDKLPGTTIRVVHEMIGGN